VPPGAAHHTHQIRIPIMVIDDRKMETAYWRDGNGMDSVIPANSGRTPCKHSKFTTSLQPQATNRQTLQVHPEPATLDNRQANTPSPPQACDPRQQTGKHSKSTTSLRPQATDRQTLQVHHEPTTPSSKQAYTAYVATGRAHPTKSALTPPSRSPVVPAHVMKTRPPAK
jgi:CCR4-NOT transcriptional regulation complex NOT5 subunit